MIASKMFAVIAGAGTYTAATAPTAAAAGSGAVITVSDLNNSQWRSDGAYWRPLGGEQSVYAPATKIYTGPTGGEEVFAFTLAAKFLAPQMEIWESHKSVKVGANGTNSQSLKLGGSGGTTVAYSTALGATLLASRSAALLGAGAVGAGNLVFTGSLLGTTTAETGTSTTAFAEYTHAVVNDLEIYLSANLASGSDTLQTRNIRINIRG